MADISQTPGNVAPSGTSPQFTAAAAVAIVAGQPCVVTNDSITLSDANGAAAVRTCNALSTSGGGVGQRVSYVKADSGINIGATLVSGGEYYVSENAGAITATKADVTSGSTAIVIGVATSTSLLNFNPTVGGTK